MIRINLNKPIRSFPIIITSTQQRYLSYSNRLAMRIVPVPVRSDNYAYLLIDEPSKLTAVIDPYEPKKIIEEAKKLNVILTPTILTTHHHHDHSGGNEEYINSFITHQQQEPFEIKVYGGSFQIPKLNQFINQDYQPIEFGQSIKIKCIKTECHTLDSICYYVEDQNQRAVFTGDTLFIAGCGRFFEGTAKQMNISLNHKLANLPDDTKTYIGHEYTKSNVDFALSIDPNNANLLNLKRFLNNHSITTGQFTIGDEKKFNPFMRLNDPQIIKSTIGQQQSNDDDFDVSNKVMERLREMKNAF